MVRTRFRSDAIDKHDTWSFAQIVVDGYSNDDINDGYLTGILLKVGSLAGPGSTTLELHADDGEINQIGTGQVTFSGNVLAKQDVHILGDLVVDGTRTELNVDVLTVEDPIEVLNSTGTELLTDWSGISARDGDGYNRFGYVFNGGLTDGYWALSVLADADPDANPTRAVAYIGAGDAYGDLSSIIDGDSGADKIAITPIVGLLATSVQEALEEINSSGTPISPPKGIWGITSSEAAADELDTSRTVDLGEQVDVSSFTDTEFARYIHVYLDGQLQVNDTSPALSPAAVVNDVARQSGDLSSILFRKNIKTGAVVQVIDMT